MPDPIQPSSFGQTCAAQIRQRKQDKTDRGEIMSYVEVADLIDIMDAARIPAKAVSSPKAKGKKPGSNIPPTAEEVTAYCQKQGYAFNGQEFCDFYESKGWVVGKAKMKNWQAATRTWARQDRHTAKPKPKGVHDLA